MQVVESTNYENILSIYFDERKDHTLVMERSEEKRAKKKLLKNILPFYQSPEASSLLGLLCPS